MATETPGTNHLLRILLIAACALLFLGAIAYSGLKVRYHFNDKANTEPTVTELSLSHSIKRDAEGKLEAKAGSETNKGARRPCPT